MRPGGPGLVVMALAFLSGARRSTSQQSTPIKGGKFDRVGDDSTGSLGRINPWLSACDLAQPNSAPDLQGQCSAGTSTGDLLWVNEGPGPPSPQCPMSCNELSSSNGRKFKSIMDSNLNMEERKRFYEKQQCLEYLGDDKESSPAQICKKSSREISTKLRTLRLRHCCERNVFSALHNDALNVVTNGGSGCEKTLNDLLDVDALANRITCELNEILIRYDCRQLYSIKHGCRDCKEAYRRWVCSTLIPYFAEPDDIRPPNLSVNNGHAPTNSSSTAIDVRSSQIGLVSDPSTDDDPVVFRILNRSRRKSDVLRRRKVKPCLTVCQTVEEQCPYMLPADRAPAYPTQYAGEPTFLCLDLNIPETGDQLVKSNNGLDTCCYRYCGSVYDEICAHCEVSTEQDVNDSTVIGLEKQSHVHEATIMVCQTVITPTSKCTAPYYASSSSSIYKVSSITINSNVHLWWTISWCFLILKLMNNTIAEWTNMLSFQFTIL